MATYHADGTRIENPDGETTEVTLKSRAAELADLTCGDYEIYHVSSKYTIFIPEGTDISALEPTFTLSQGATVDKTGPQDFNEPVIYTVTAEDGVTTKEFTVEVELELNFDEWEDWGDEDGDNDGTTGGDDDAIGGDDENSNNITNTGHSVMTIFFILLPTSLAALMIFKKKRQNS